ncbi:Uncharacterised protein [Mycobacteroides abscessus subsp. abscessus]|nr:Uncharacterised protein [Mycobacteroides abscessus subsp. abscessus]
MPRLENFTNPSLSPRTQPKVHSTRIATWLVCHIETVLVPSVSEAVSLILTRI